MTVALDTQNVDQMAGIVNQLGQAGFYPALLQFLRSLINADMGVTLAYSVDRRPQYIAIQADAATKRGAREVAYLDGPYVLDPVYQMFKNGQADGAYAMASYVPDDFYESEFYRCFFRNTHLIDTIDILWRLDTYNTIAFCLGREEGLPAFGETELAVIRQILPFAFALMRRHHQLTTSPVHDEADRLVHRKVESTMINFGSSLLTKREREVVFYMLSGYSSKQTAERLHSAEGTVRNQRKSIHAKLETGSQAELFSLFVYCIPFAEPGTDTDPLARYAGRSGGTDT